MYKYKIGERLFPARSCGLIVRNGAYVIVKRLPMRDGEFEYQIRSLTEPDERVVRESQLRSNPFGNKLGRPLTSGGQALKLWSSNQQNEAAVGRRLPRLCTNRVSVRR
jgi:hypothetical protein